MLCPTKWDLGESEGPLPGLPDRGACLRLTCRCSFVYWSEPQ